MFQLILLQLMLLMFSAVGSSQVAGACSNNFFVLEQSLLESTDNRFNLLKAFYPPREAHPVLVRVNYTFDGTFNDTSQIWFWSESEFYLIQPLEIFQFTSLLFSNMPYRQSQLHIRLDSDCSQAPAHFLQMLTTRLKLYAQSPTTGTSAATQSVSDQYLAIATSWTEVSEDTLQSNFVKVWLHVTIALFPIGTWLLLYLCDPIQLLLGDKTWTKLEDEHSHGTMAAMIQISVIFTVYVFILDICSVYFTITSDFLSYDSNAAFYLSTVTGLIVDVGTFLWVVFVMVSSCQWDCKNFLQRLRRKDLCRDSHRIKKLVSTTTVAPVVCFANHLHFIMLSFISDPFHAGSIAIVYVIAFFLFFFMFRQFYNRVVLQSNKRPKVVPRIKLCPKCSAKEKNLWHPLIHKITSTASTTGDNDETNSYVSPNDKCNCFFPGPNCHTPFNTQVMMLGLVTVGPLVIFYLAISVVLFYSLPLTKTIEDAPSRIYTIYQGTGLLVVGLLTYNILLLPNPFSISKTLERLAKRLHLPENTNYWNRLSDEEKCAKVVATLLETYFQRTLESKSKDDKESTECEDSRIELITVRDGEWQDEDNTENPHGVVADISV